MGKQSRAKKERRAARLNGQNQPANDYRILDNAPVIPSDVVIAYLITKFIGKAGYRYISIGRHGSLFMNDKAADMVAVTLHREYPVMSVRGRFNDPQRRDIAVNAVHVPVGFPGLVIGRDGISHIGGSSSEATVEDLKNVAVDLYKVTKEEYDEALKLEQPLIEAQLKKLHDTVQKDIKESTERFNAAEKSLDAYGNDVTPYSDVVIPEVEEEVGSVGTTDPATITDAEIIE